MLKPIGLIVLAIFSISALAEQSIRTQCEPLLSDSLTCECRLKEKSNNHDLGVALFACVDLSCEEFTSVFRPDTCEQGMRGVTCWVSRPYFTCPLMIPRLSAHYQTPDICAQAVDDINANGGQSIYYKNLDYARCAGGGNSYPPVFGWTFTGDYQDGWN